MVNENAGMVYQAINDVERSIHVQLVLWRLLADGELEV
jgi:hypothetical protein